MLKINNVSVSPIVQSKSDKLSKFVDGTLNIITGEDLEGCETLKNYAFYQDNAIKSISHGNLIFLIRSLANIKDPFNVGTNKISFPT